MKLWLGLAQMVKKNQNKIGYKHKTNKNNDATVDKTRAKLWTIQKHVRLASRSQPKNYLKRFQLGRWGFFCKPKRW